MRTDAAPQVPAPPELDPQPLTPSGPRPGVLQSRSFRLLFLGQAISSVGDRLVMVAMPFAVLSIHGAGAADVGLVLGTGALALAVFILAGGVLADRWSRRATMLTSDLVRALAQGVGAVLLLTGSATVLGLVIVQFVYGAAEAFFRPAMLALLPQVVDDDELHPANALLGLSSNLSMVAGPAIAGVLVAAIGAGGALAFDAATFALSAASLAALKQVRRLPRRPRLPFATELTAGWRAVTSRGWVWSTILSFAGYHALVLPAVFVLGPLVVKDGGGGAVAWGVITAAFGAGAVLGSVVALRWRPSRPGIVIALTLLVASSQSAIVTTNWSTGVVASLESLTGVAVALTFTVWQTAQQRHVPPEIQARVSSFDFLGSTTLMPFGYLVVGLLVNVSSSGTLATLASVAAGLICLSALSNRSLRQLT